MGRWGDGIYEGDSAMDYFAIITEALDREINYLCIPEKVFNKAWWLNDVLAAIEVLLLFDQYVRGSTVFLREPQIVIRWREAFFRVWDGDWEFDGYEKNLPYNHRDFRKQHRPGIVAMFDRLESIAWDHSMIGKPGLELTEIKSLHPDYPLPFFSHANLFIYRLRDMRIHEILYWLGDRRWTYVADDAIMAAIDVIGFLSEAYDISPGIGEALVHTWRASIMKKFKDASEEVWDESDPLYQSIADSFDRLEAMAKKYPPMEW
jgi:hypothetical protein